MASGPAVFPPGRTGTQTELEAARALILKVRKGKPHGQEHSERRCRRERKIRFVT